MINTGFAHKEVVAPVSENVTLKEGMVCAHAVIKQLFPFLAQIAITTYDPATTLLGSYIDSSDRPATSQYYQAYLEDERSLKELLDKGCPRVINNLATCENSEYGHIKRLRRERYAANYTVPVFANRVLSGFIFFSSYKTDVFTDDILDELDIVGHIIFLFVISERGGVDALAAVAETKKHIAYVRDAETGCHLDRVSRYSRLIAVCLANKYNLDDAYIEHILVLSKLHNIGKLGIPDSILLKPGSLKWEEIEIMRTHTRRGLEILDDLISSFGLGHFGYASILRNIVEYHHEAINGTGYPEGKERTEIPLKARIVAVADVFDALTSDRPYKKAMSNDKAFTMLKEMAGEKLDRDCVDSIIYNRREVEEIQDRFKEDKFG